jgi:GTP cyclohydrolase I
VTLDDQRALDEALDDLRRVRPILDQLANQLVMVAASEPSMCEHERLAAHAMARIAYVLAHEDQRG